MATDPMARATDGRMTDFRFGPRPWESRLNPVAGKMWSLTATSSTSNGPTTKVGRASMPKVEVVAIAVEEPVGAQRGDQGHGDGDEEGQDLGDDDELEVDGHGHADGVGHRLLGEEGEPRLPWKTLVIQVPYCGHEALVEPQLVQQLGPGAGRVVGPQDGQGGVAGQEVDEQEGDDRDEEADDDQLDQPAGDVAEHGRVRPQALRQIGRGVEDAGGEPEGPWSRRAGSGWRSSAPCCLPVSDQVARETHR